MKYKNKRQEKLMELVLAAEVETQDDLSLMLRDAGFPVTQATVSRDLKDMGLVKVAGREKRFRYVPVQETAQDPGISAEDRFSSLLREGIVGVACAQNLVVIKCHSGMAQAVCAVIDRLEYPTVMGSIAGEDTIFLAVTDTARGEELCTDLRKMLQGQN